MSSSNESKTVVGFVAVSCLALVLVAGAAPQQPSTPVLPDVQKLGPQVGARVPDFTLSDQEGQQRSLQSLMGPKGLMLVFSRSADWCPYCKTQLAELQTRSANLKKQGINLAAMTYDPVPILADFSKRRGITFPLLSDPGSATIKRYGILNTTVPETNQQSYGIPFPGTFMLNPQGVVTARFFEQAYQERNTVGSILARLGNNVDVAATKVSSPQVEITSYATDTIVAPGTHFSVVLDVRPAAGVHVYAPGVTGYKPIALSVQPQPGLLTRGAQYPPAEDYHFKPLNEHVQVYQRPFRIVQDVLIDPSPQAALKDVSSLTIKGVLSYQACDDKLCFTPQSVPLMWTVSLRQLDRERPKPRPAGARSSMPRSQAARTQSESLAASPTLKEIAACLASSSVTSTRPCWTSAPWSRISSRRSETVASCRTGLRTSFSTLRWQPWPARTPTSRASEGRRSTWWRVLAGSRCQPPIAPASSREC